MDIYDVNIEDIVEEYHSQWNRISFEKDGSVYSWWERRDQNGTLTVCGESAEQVPNDICEAKR